MTENYRKTVFCEVQFLKECVSQIETDEHDNAYFQRLRFWKSIRNLLLSPGIKLCLDISNDEFASEIKDIEKSKRKIAKKNGNAQLGGFEELFWEISCGQLDSTVHLKCLGENFVPFGSLESRDKLNLNAIYLTSSDADMCEELSRTYGISVLSSKKMKAEKQQFEDVGCAIYKGEKGTGWTKILQNKCKSCNALIIVDNYVLSNLSQLDDNLRAILQSLLPDRLANDIPFHLSIFTSDLRSQSKERWDKLQDMLKELRPDLRCEVSIFKNDISVFHDRTIITNNLWIGCGGGFDLFKKGAADKMTVVNIVNPYLTDTMQWAKKAYSNLLKSIKGVIAKKNEYIADSYTSFYLGTGINRLTE